MSRHFLARTMYFIKPIIGAVLVAFLGCLQSTDAGKVFNGVQATPNEYPFVAWFLIGTRRVHCGGALIAPNLVLTSATCAIGNVIESVILGDHTRSVDEGTEQTFTVIDTFINPRYNSTSGDGDLAIVKLSGSAVEDATVQVAPILMKNDNLVDRVMAKRCRVVGWGSVVDNSNLVSDQSDVLLKYTALVLNDSVCAASGAPSTSVCYTPFRDPTSVTCKGDVGGPMMCKRKRVWNVVGVLVDFNMDDGCKQGTKAVTKLTFFNKWINRIISNEGS